MQFPNGIYVYGDKSFKGKCLLERDEIKAFFAMLRNVHPHLGLIATHTRNEGKRSKWQAYQHKKEGLVTGAADIVIPGCPSFVCELKRKNHNLSEITEAQVDYLQACKASGSFVCIALGADAALQAVGKWLDYSKKLQAAMTKEMKPKTARMNEQAIKL